MRECSEDDCQGKHIARELCHKHYQSQRRSGRLVSQSTWGRFLSRVDADPDGCWLWKGTLNTAGYGRFAMKGKWALAHRASYELHVGPIPDGLTLDHLCRNPPCVNPDHLEPVTQGENNTRRRLCLVQ